MRRLTPKDLRSLIWFAVSRLPKSLLVEMQQSKDRLKQERAVDIATDRICGRLDGHEVLAPDPIPPH